MQLRQPALSIVSTLFRSESTVKQFCERSAAAAAGITSDFEIVLVNDGSPDGSLSVALELQARDPRIRIVDLSRNFGHHKAIMTGLAHARGALVFLLDSDLEEPPEALSEFYTVLRDRGVDVVYGVQSERKGGIVERVTGHLFFRIFNALSSYPLPSNLVTLRLMTRRYVASLLSHQERETIVAGLWVLTGYAQLGIPVTKGSRGTSSYSLTARVANLVNAVTSFSDRPLVLIFYIGTTISFAAAVAAAQLIVRKVWFSIPVAGYPSLMVSVWLLGGLTIFCLGVIGVYLSKVFIETKQRPYTIVRQVYDASAAATERRP